jgi:hypothetical protein
MKADQITWTQDIIADVPLQRFTAHAGEVEIGYVEYTAAIACGCGRAVSPKMLGVGVLPTKPQKTDLRHG